MSDIWFIVIFLVPVLLTTLLRVSGVYVYLALCLGYVLSQFDGGSKIVTKLAGSSKVIEKLGGSNDIRLILLLLPVVLILAFCYKTAHGSKFSLNLLPAIAAGLLTVLMVVPLLPLSTAVNIMGGSLWLKVINYEGDIVGLSSLVVVVMLILHRSKSFKKRPYHHNKSRE